MTTRREFVSGAAAALGAAALVPRVATALGRGSIPGGWSIARGATLAVAAERIERIGVQLYTVRAEMRKDFAASLARIAQIGYREVEFAGYFSQTPDRVRALLDENRLTSPSVHLAIELLESDFGAQAAVAKTIGQETLIVPSLNARTLTTTDAWKGIATRFNTLGAKARDAGLRFAFHNHASEATAMSDGTRPFDVLLGETDPSLVDFQMDLYWMIKAGGDPLAYFASNPGRFTSVHVKDATAAPELAMRDVGAGSVDWKAIFAKRSQAGIKHFFVEHDSPGADPFASVKASHDYLAKLEF
ncbi:MAG: sugar phosphate isomerase/epimerase [Gemmatimonadetes bacterium]|nr:sugar phosphate isomerase/epimerase [Gemmatimonadota bacterium]